MNYSKICIISLFSYLSLLPVKAETELNSVISAKQETQRQAQKTQQQIIELDEKTSEVVNEYRALLRENAILDTYNQQLDKQQLQQQKKLQSLAMNMANVREVRMELMPLMQEMVKVLTLFVNNDVPFLWQERQLRLTELNNLLDNPNVNVADKYRRIVEAYQIETEYGDTLETWQAQLPLSTENKAVQLIKVGRIALYYLTPDQQMAGYWDNNARTWKTLPESWLTKVKQAYQIANNKTVPSLLALPYLPAQRQQEAQ
ncbi:DUF3450 domain-containing protein [Psychromonas algicola]|uniref:DUF3450 domain-containing protein n=1 Tax=Psychromonas algicola TaxID=2555642 RepID=UPI0010677C18|nr:DUF3450 domain-containing protein [Psychromonas sp. RZ5]TEW52290.1 DUF3450 domain-containing protein [Psychromonas sp. RZ5]